MKQFTYTVKAADGLHARPAGILVKEAAKFSSDITMSFNGKEASVKKLFALMKLGVKQGDTVTITANGADESDAVKMIETFMGEHF
ncbi:MAG TPA: HPr family phosphocarrier protein [Candidatus Treponema faecavium]|nr:HPr family phosphocarrier protein [Candidatus Treponema faecavium]